MNEYNNELKRLTECDEEITVVRRTKDYNKFKLLVGNRSIGEDRIKKIRESLEEVGYVLNPIIVNENFEIIDGQGRFATFKELNMPIDYIIAKGAGVNECVAMNVNQTKWKLEDFIESMADMGKESYIRLLRLMEKFPKFGLNDIECAVSGRMRSTPSELKSGIYRMTEEQYQEAIIRLNRAQELYNRLDLKALKSVGSYHVLVRLYIICMDFEQIDMTRLDKVILKGIYTSIPFKDETTCANSISKLYDSGLKDKKYIDFLFKQRSDAINSEKLQKQREKRYGESMKATNNLDNVEFDMSNQFADSNFAKLSNSIKSFLLEENNISAFKEKNIIPLVDIYKMYYEHCVRNRVKPLPSTELYKQLEFVGFERGARATSSNKDIRDNGQYQAAYVPKII